MADETHSPEAPRACAPCHAGVLALRRALDAERRAFEASKDQVVHDLSAVRRRIKLNIGGTRYETSAATLTRYENSYFGVLLSGRFELERDEEDGSIFLDRNGAIFGTVLEFLRTGVARMPDTASEALALLTELRCAPKAVCVCVRVNLGSLIG